MKTTTTNKALLTDQKRRAYLATAYNAGRLRTAPAAETPTRASAGDWPPGADDGRPKSD